MRRTAAAAHFLLPPSRRSIRRNPILAQYMRKQFCAPQPAQTCLCFFARAVSSAQRLCRSGMRAGGRRVERMVSFRREVVAFAEGRRPNFVRCGRCCADRLTAAGNRCILSLSLAAVTFERCGRFNDLAGIRIRVLSGIIQHCATVLQHRRSCLRALRNIRRLVASSAAKTKKSWRKHYA